MKRIVIVTAESFLYSTIILSFLLSRLYRVDEFGIRRGDSVGYIEAAPAWAGGNFNVFSAGFMRPTPHALYGLVLHFFGHPTYSIKVLNGIADTLSLCILMLFLRQLTGRSWPAWIAAMLYAASERTLEYARSEFVHTLCNFFVICSFYLFYRSQSSTKGTRSGYALAFFSGVFMSLAVTTHPSTGLMGAGAVAGIVICQLAGSPEAASWRRRLLRAAAQAALYSAGYASLIVLCLIYYGPRRAIESLLRDGGGQADYTKLLDTETANPLVAFAKVFTDVYTIALPSVITAKYFGPVFVIALVALLPLLARRRPAPSAGILFGALASIFAFCLSFYVAGGAFDPASWRVLLNIASLLLAFALGTLALFGERFVRGRPGYAYSALTSLALAASAWPFVTEAKAGKFDYLYKPNVYQWAFNALSGNVDAERRALILPNVFYMDRALTRPYYFGENAVYIAGEEARPQQTFDEYFFEQKFAYVLWFHENYDERSLDPAYRALYKIPPDFYTPYRQEGEPYSRAWEQRFLGDFLARVRSWMLISTHFGDVYYVEPNIDDAFLDGATNLLQAPKDLNSGFWVKSKRLTGISRGLTPLRPGLPMEGHRIEALLEGYFFQNDSVAVQSGDVATAEVWLWSHEDCEVRVRVSRDGNSEFEGSNIVVKLTPEPARYTVSHEFQAPHRGARLTIEPVVSERGAEVPVEFNVAGTRLSRTRPTSP